MINILATVQYTASIKYQISNCKSKKECAKEVELEDLLVRLLLLQTIVLYHTRSDFQHLKVILCPILNVII